MAGIFHAYDIRGVYPDEINEAIAQKIAFALCEMFPGVNEFCIGRDARVSSPSLFTSMMDAFVDSGKDVTDIGMVSTPMSYFASGKYGFGATIQITASHNPKEYNGMKICRENAIALSYEGGIRKIEEKVKGGVVVKPSINKGKVKKLDVSLEYINHIMSFTDIQRPLKIVVDASNGAVGPIVERFFKNIDNIELYPLFCEPDGTFPNHSPNPMKEDALTNLKEKVKETGADLGAIFDADGDRVMFIDENLNRVKPDIITALIAIEILKKQGPCVIGYDLRSSRAVPEIIREHGGEPVITRVGHAYMKEVMREKDSPFAGELSGHYYFKDNYFADSGMLALVKVLNIASQDNRPFSEIIKAIDRYYATGEINFKVANPDEVLKKTEEAFAYKPDVMNIMKLDGLTVEFENWWFNLRKSNTEPLVRLNLEADTPQRMEEKKEFVISIIKGA